MENVQTPLQTTPPVAAPIRQLDTNRGLLKFILLSIITFNIYGIVVMSKVSSDINIIATRYDGKKNNALLPSLFLCLQVLRSAFVRLCGSIDFQTV